MDTALPWPCCVTRLRGSSSMILVDEVKMIPKALLLLLLAVSTCFAREVVKIRVVNNVVLVPVRVNGRDLSFLLDTGSEHSAIDASVASSLNLGQVADVEVLKNYRTQPATTDRTTKIEIGGLAFDGQEPYSSQPGVRRPCAGECRGWCGRQRHPSGFYFYIELLQGRTGHGPSGRAGRYREFHSSCADRATSSLFPCG